MVQVNEATYIINSHGGEMQSEVMLGPHKISATIAVGKDEAFLRSLLDELSVRVEKIGYLAIEGRREINITMGMGTRQFVARVPLVDGDGKLSDSIDQLLQTVGTRFMRTLELAVHGSETREFEPEPVAEGSAI